MDLSINWNSIFVPAIGLAEIFVRGSLMYLGLFRCHSALYGAASSGTFRAGRPFSSSC